MSVNTRSMWGEAATTVIKKWANDPYKQYTSKYPLVANVETSEGAFEEYMNNSGISGLTQVDEGAQIPQADPTKGYKTRVTNAKYGNTIAVTREENDDNRYKVWQKRASWLGKAAARHQDKKFFSLARNGFSTSFTPYGDGVPLFSTIHPTKKTGGSTQSNASATGITLTEANLFTGEQALQNQMDDSGELFDLSGEKIVLMVPPALKKTAFEILMSDLRSATTDNDTNYYYHGAMYDLFVNPWIGSNVSATETGGTAGSDTAWYIIAPGVSELLFQKRDGLKIETETDFDTEVLKAKGTVRFGIGAENWRGTWGSLGDGAAYSS